MPPPPPSVGEEGTNDIFIEALDEDLTSEDSIQFGSDGDDLVTAIAADESVQNDFVIVGSTSSVDDHLFDTQINSSESAKSAVVPWPCVACVSVFRHAVVWFIVFRVDVATLASCYVHILRVSWVLMCFIATAH